jgi:hypothetical protein
MIPLYKLIFQISRFAGLKFRILGIPHRNPLNKPIFQISRFAGLKFRTLGIPHRNTRFESRLVESNEGRSVFPSPLTVDVLPTAVRITNLIGG